MTQEAKIRDAWNAFIAECEAGLKAGLSVKLPWNWRGMIQVSHIQGYTPERITDKEISRKRVTKKKAIDTEQSNEGDTSDDS